MADQVVEQDTIDGAARGKPRASLVETIPLGMEDLHRTGMESTAAALIRLVTAAARTIDLTALYWSLQPSVDDDDTHGWTETELLTEFGAAQGAALYASLGAAADRDVRIRIVESPGFEEPGRGTESGALLAAHPGRIEVRSMRVEDWFGSGIMHQKLWVFDGRSIYVGSANNDWRSLSQVKELGVIIEDAPEVAADATQYFETWWAFAQLEATRHRTTVVFDADSQIERRVPTWSSLVAAEQRAPNPLEQGQDGAVAPSWERPLRVRLNGEDGHVVLSGAPKEVCVAGRAFDGDLIAASILDATKTMCVNVMDFAPVSIYRPAPSVSEGGLASPVWWPGLFDALLRAVSTKRVHARLLVSEWTHTSPFVAPYLDALDAAARAASANPRMAAGTLEIRRFRVPGWQQTGPRTHAEPVRYPGHTRVNHVKYVVTDRRANIGTSNMTWDYFSATAGTSVNLSHRSVVGTLQALFDRDWESAYASPIGPGPSGFADPTQHGSRRDRAASTGI